MQIASGIFALVFFGGFIFCSVATFILALRHGRRLPALSREEYRPQAIKLFLAPFLLAGFMIAFSSLGLFMIAIPLWAIGLFVIQYHLLRCGVQRLSDIDGETYRGWFLAMLSYHPFMIIYLCCRRGTMRQMDIDVF